MTSVGLSTLDSDPIVFISTAMRRRGISFCTLYSIFGVIPRRQNFICRRFGILGLFHLHRWRLVYTECGRLWSAEVVPGFFLFVTVCIQPVLHLSVYYGIVIVFFYKCDCTYVL